MQVIHNSIKVATCYLIIMLVWCY